MRSIQLCDIKKSSVQESNTTDRIGSKPIMSILFEVIPSKNDVF